MPKDIEPEYFEEPEAVEVELPFDDEDGPLKEANGEFRDLPGEEA